MSKGRPGLSQEQKRLLWVRWRDGCSMSDIARELGKHPASVWNVLVANGGVAPTSRKRSARALTLAEREEISRGLAAGHSLRHIARGLGRPACTVSREVARNGGAAMYRASVADQAAWNSAKRPKCCLLARYVALCRRVAGKLKQQWSPMQISCWLKLHFPNDEAHQVSHETIYKSLFIQARGVLKKELVKHLRSRRLMRRSKLATSQPRGGIKGSISISERPAEVADRAVPGHWEGDLVSGAKNSHIATLVERHSRFTILVKVNGKDTESVVGALSRQVRRLPVQLRKSLTWDRGMEMANHQDFTVATDVSVYFCDPKSPWQRGSNENTNGLLRQYFPDGTDLSIHSQAQLNKIAKRLNQRPRQTLQFMTPAEKLSQALR